MKYFLSLLALVFTCNVYAQLTVVDTPHCLNHTLHAEVTGGLIPTPSGITVDDGWSGVIPIGFTYNFYGASYTQCIIGSNGLVGFNLGSAGAYCTWPISSTWATTGATDIRNCIAGPWCDVYIPAGGTITYSTQGTAPNRNFAVTWCGTRMFSCTTEWLTTQIIIYETSGLAEVHLEHRTICSTGWNGQRAIIGVRNAAGTSSTSPPTRDFAPVWVPLAPEGWRFTPIPGPSYSVTSTAFAPIPYATSTIYWYDSATHTYLGSGPDVIVTPTVTTTYVAVALGCNDSTKAYISVGPPSCFRAISNNPCVGDTLHLGAVGDSTGVSYAWTGPAGFTNTAQYPFIYPTSMANGGLYRVIKIVGGSPVDTDSVYVTIHPLPVVTVASNAPICLGMGDSLQLFVNLDSLGETFAWTGPAGFSSAAQLPTVPGFDATNVGWYAVTATTVWGCKDTGSTYAGLIPPPPAPVISGITQYCYGATFVPFTVAGANILWYPTFASTVGSPTAPVVNTSAPGTYTYYATQTVGCLSPKDSITVTVFPRITPAFDFTIDRACEADTVYFYNTSANSFSYTWNFGDATPDIIDTTSALLSHVHVFPVRGQHSVTITGHNPVCNGDTTIIVDTRHDVKADYDPLLNDTVCFGASITFNNLSTATIQGTTPGQIVINAWSFGNGVTDNSVSPVYQYPQPGKYPARLVVTDSIGCMDSITKAIFVIEMSMNITHDTTLCISQPLPLRNTPIMIPDIGWTDYSFNWSPANNLSDPNVQNPFFSGFGSYTYIVTNTMNGYGCQAIDSIHINSVPGSPIASLTADSWIILGDKIQLNAGGQVFYYWTPNDGSLDDNNINNPVARPTHTTTYTIYGLDVNGCLDSAYVTINVDTSTTQDVPTGFTPNNDGRNDVFKPVGIKFQHLVEFRIYNRWGQEIFYTNNKEVGWDGTFHGVPQEMGVYNYAIIVAMPGGNNVVYKGNVTLIR